MPYYGYVTTARAGGEVGHFRPLLSWNVGQW